ncbi:MAG: hypothetical protein RL885_15210 [Planctomycetota bacterium]
MVVSKKLTGLVMVLTASVWSCSGPERAPHQPITGVDRPYDSQPDDGGRRAPTGDDEETDDGSLPSAMPDDRGSSSTSAPTQRSKHFLGEFIQEVAAAALDMPGNIAVFPAMKRNSDTGDNEIDGLGDHLAETTATELELAGVSGLIHGSQLVNDIKASNRGLDSWCGLDDVYWLAERIGARYAIFGTANRKTFDRLARDETLEVVWQCIRVDDRFRVALYRKELTGDLAQQLYRYTRTDTSWAICQDAPTFEPGLDPELRIAMRVLGQRLAAEHGAKLAGHRVQVDPMSIPSLQGERAQLQAWALAFQRAFDQAERRADDGSILDRDAIWEQGPVSLMGTEYETFRAAAEQYEQKLSALSGSKAGALSKDLSNLLGATIQRHLGGNVTLVSDDSERDQLLQLIRAEASAAQRDGAVDPSTIADLRASGAEMLVTSSLRPIAESYQITVVLTDLATGAKSIEDFPLEARFSPGLRAILGA